MDEKAAPVFQESEVFPDGKAGNQSLFEAGRGKKGHAVFPEKPGVPAPGLPAEEADDAASRADKPAGHAEEELLAASFQSGQGHCFPPAKSEGHGLQAGAPPGPPQALHGEDFLAG